MIEKTKTVMVGMSGGVDSTVTALLLQEQGYEVVGVTFQLWHQNAPANVADAKVVCKQLGIPHYVFDYQERFLQKVVEPFVADYAQGRTPNPCVSCNRYIKFDHFLHRARGMGFDYIATGHYAQVEQQESGEYFLREGVSKARDQSYFLYNLTQDELAHVLMPLGTYDKPDVRKIAQDQGYHVAQKADSQDICFIADGDYAEFLRSRGSIPQEGDFVDAAGTVLGRHSGIQHYTIGQRKGLGMTFGKPMYVVEIDAAKNRVVLGDEEGLFRTELLADNINWINPVDLQSPLAVQAKIRYAAKPAAAIVHQDSQGSVRVVFEQPQRAITCGQSVVFYDGDIVLGGGVIVE